MGFKEARQALQTQLTATGLKVVDHVPEGFSPPVVLLQSGDTYIENDDRLQPGEYIVTLDVILIANPVGSNGRRIDQLDDMVETVLGALGTWTLDKVNGAVELPTNESEYVACTMQVNNIVEI